MFTTIALLVACSPTPAKISFDGDATETVHTLDPMAVENASVLADDGTKIDPQPAITWTVTPDGVAKLDGAKVVPVANGEATVTAAVGDVKGEYKVVVALPDKVAVAGYAAGDAFAVGDTKQLTGSVMSGTAAIDGAKIDAWTSSNPLVVNIDASGKAQALAAGTATITATAGTLNGTVDMTVAPPAATTADAGTATPPK